jgi:hypothetical protein
MRWSNWSFEGKVPDSLRCHKPFLRRRHFRKSFTTRENTREYTKTEIVI